MKTNTFYNPKNQYNELLASVNYVNAEDSALDKKFTDEIARVDGRIDTETENRDAADNAIHHKIDTFNTIKVKWINADRGDNRWSNIKDYFRSLLEPTAATSVDREALKVELGQTIYIIEGKDDATTWEEWVCQYPNFDQNHEDYEGCKIPVMIRLGAVDSILATADAPGSVRLIHNLYNEVDWSKYFATDYEGNISHKPIKGEAVAPCALKAFVDRDNEISDKLSKEISDRENVDTSIRTDINAALEKLTSDYIAADNTLDKRLTSLEVEVGGSTIDDEVDKHDSRLDRIEAAIGMNHQHCDNCGCEHDQCSTHDSCSCSDATNKCTIYCRLNDAESDLQSHMDTLEAHDERIEGLEALTEKHTADIGNLQAEDASIRTLIGEEVTRLDDLIKGNVDRLDGRIDNAEVNITENKNYILTVEERLEEEETRSKSIDANLREDIDTEVEVRTELSDYVHHVLDTTVSNHSTSINNNANAIDAHGIRITAAESKIGDLQSNLSATDKTVSEHYSQFSAKTSEFAAAIGTNTNAIANINSDITNRINNKLNSLDVTDAEIVSSISDLETKVDAVDSNLNDRLAKAERDINTATSDINTNKADLTALTSRIIVAEEKLENHEQTIIANGALTHQNSNAISELNTKLGDAENAITSNTSRINSSETKIHDAEQNIITHNERITAAEGTIELLDERVDYLEINSATKESLQVAQTAAITTATENAKQYTDVEIGKFSLKLSTDIANAKQEAKDAVDEANENIALVKADLLSAIDSKVSKETFDTILETKASSNDLAETNNGLARTDTKLTTVEKDLEDISHELHHLTSQTQFAVRTSIPGAGVKTIQFYNLVGPASNEWDLIRITSVIANKETIYPEIEYSGELTDEKNDERKVEITFEHGGNESLPVTLIVSAFKASEYRIIEID